MSYSFFVSYKFTNHFVIVNILSVSRNKCVANLGVCMSEGNLRLFCLCVGFHLVFI